MPCGARAHEVIEEHIDFPVADIRTEILDFRADDLDESLNIADADVIVCVGNAIKGRTPCRAIAVWQSASAARSPARARCSTAACCRSSSSSGSPALWSSRSCCCRSVCRARSNHVTGFSDADVVVAVNTDPEAAIFNYCTYGIVGDMDEVCEAMLAKLGE